MRIGNLSLPGLFVLAALATLSGCNLFNPGGGESGSSVCELGDTDCHMTLGQQRLNNKNFAGAMRSFERAIASDSTRSLAYYSYAKAVGFRFNLDRIQILTDLSNASSEGPMAFLGHPDEDLTNRLLAGSRARRALALLTDRDTLTRWYNYLNASSDDTTDPEFANRVAFMEQYLIKADLDSAGYRRRGDFPLSDLVMGYSAVVLDYTAYEILYTITRLYDLDGNDTINEADAMMKKLLFNKDGTFGNLDSLASDLEDSATAANFNTLIQNMQSGLATSSQLAQLIAPGSGDGGASDEASENVDSVIANLGDAVLFYQFGDGKDNDGDGCIDEEVLDEKDNDGDGFVDEDARTLYNPFNLGAGRHDNRGSSGDTVGTTTFRGNTVNFVAFVHQFYQDNPSLDSHFVKIKKDGEQMDFRLRIQRDSLTQRSAAQLAGPLAAKLDSAKTLIGGCWRYYP